MYLTPGYMDTRKAINDMLGIQTKKYGRVAGTNIGGKSKKKRKASAWNKFFAEYRHRHPEWSIKRIGVEYRRHYGLKKKPKRKPKRETKKGGVLVGGQCPWIDYIHNVKQKFPAVSPKMALEMSDVGNGGVKYKRRGGRLKAKGAKKNPWLQFIQYHKRLPKKYWQDLYWYEKPLQTGLVEKGLYKIVKQRIKEEIPEAKPEEAETIAKQVQEDLRSKYQREQEELAEYYKKYRFEEPEGEGSGGMQKNAWLFLLKSMKKFHIPRKYLLSIYHKVKKRVLATAKRQRKSKRKLSKWNLFVRKMKKQDPSLSFGEISAMYKK